MTSAHDAGQWTLRPHSRRAVLVAAAVGTGAKLAGGAVVAVLPRDSNTPATPATPTPPAGPSPGATATPTATAPAGGAIEPAGQAFEVAAFADGQRIPWREGVFAMDTVTGAVTGLPAVEAGRVGERLHYTAGGLSVDRLRSVSG
jgi:hypothetical protein